MVSVNMSGEGSGNEPGGRHRPGPPGIHFL